MAKKSTKIALRKDAEDRFRMRGFAIQYTPDRSQVNMVDGDGRLHVYKFAGIDQWNLRDTDPVFEDDVYGLNRGRYTFTSMDEMFEAIDRLQSEGKLRKEFLDTLNPYGAYIIAKLADEVRELRLRVGDLEEWRHR